MNPDDIEYELSSLDERLSKIEERLSPAGSGAATGCAGREAGGQPDGEEARSVESRAVAPGQAEAQLRLLACYDKERSKTYSSLAKSYRKLARSFYPWQFLARAAFNGAAAALEGMATSWSKSKPDSDAVKPGTVTVKGSFGYTNISAELENKRSGRRNADVEGRASRPFQ